MLDKIFFCSINQLDNRINISIKEFNYLTGINPNHELNITLKGNNISWEKRQVEHYFEYEISKPKILCNDYEQLNKIFSKYERIYFD